MHVFFQRSHHSTDPARSMHPFPALRAHSCAFPSSTHDSPPPRSLRAGTMQRRTMLLVVASLCVAPATSFTSPYPYKHTNCGIEQTIQDTPQKVITMNQGATEFMLAMGLQNNIAGQRDVSEVDPIWPRYAEACIRRSSNT